MQNICNSLVEIANVWSKCKKGVAETPLRIKIPKNISKVVVNGFRKCDMNDQRYLLASRIAMQVH